MIGRHGWRAQKSPYRGVHKNEYMSGRKRFGGGDRVRKPSPCFFGAKGSSSSSEVISLIHGGRCANILLKISWQHAEVTLNAGVFFFLSLSQTIDQHTHTHTHPGQSPLKATGYFTLHICPPGGCHGSHLRERFQVLSQISGPGLGGWKVRG